MESMKHFDVYDEIQRTILLGEQIKGAIKSRWVLRWKGDEVRCRLVAIGYDQYVQDKDDVFASTPLLNTLKALLLLGQAKNYRTLFGDVSAAFLHATLNSETAYLQPPEEYYPHKDALWKLKRPLYGLKTAPKEWQDYFADVLAKLGGRRLKSDPNVYYFPQKETYIMTT